MLQKEMEATQELDYISELFVSLSNCAEKLAFPNYRKGTFESRDMKGWKLFPKFIYNLGHPFTSTEITGTFFFIAWIVLYLAQYLAFIFGLTLLYPILFNQVPFLPPTSIEGWVILVPGVIIGIPLSLVAYAWWIDTFAAKKNSWWVKVGLGCGTIWFLYTMVHTMMMQSPSQVLWKSSGDTLSIFFSFLFLLIPAVSYFAAVIFDFVLAILLAFITVFGGIRAILEPRPVKTIMKLAIEEIPSGKPDIVPWRLYNLPKPKIEVLRHWAEANREGSEKRTVPAFLIAALISVIFSSDFIRQTLDYLLSALTKNLFTYLQAKSIFAVSIEVSISALIIIPFLAIFFISVLKYLIALFRNIVAQNLIIEACIIAEYSLELQTQNTSQQLGNMNPQNVHFLERLARLFRP
jgi:hypothetical protein